MKYVDLNASMTLPGGGVVDGVISPVECLERLSSGKGGEETSMEIMLKHNCWKREEDLIIRYEGVAESRLGIAAPSGAEARSVVILDEILSHPDGCTHEVAFRPGAVMVTCRDLIATWVVADCPEKP
ncbi:hypothetical protein HS041_34090 [Planomonospora sp. ID67723]|uniref:hypothetical protein n=1 Tax=Planomonospora sp. ID67723 TaxID=2738134 RepID=UPI0018C441B3|nr:hypothetical protein [Planomonospora sp. ID67723]MBG0832733.1 hypothetical protein [Planomonospora sp. ID67723]